MRFAEIDLQFDHARDWQRMVANPFDCAGIHSLKRSFCGRLLRQVWFRIIRSLRHCLPDLNFNCFDSRERCRRGKIEEQVGLGLAVELFRPDAPFKPAY